MEVPKHKTLWSALLEAKKEFSAIKKTKTNPHFKAKYADLELIHAAIDPALERHGLFLSQPIEIWNDRNVLVTRITHVESGEFVSSNVILKSQDDENPQKVGAAITYYRRYLLAGMLGIVADEDTDGSTGKDMKPPMANTDTRAPRAPAAAKTTPKTEAKPPAAKPVERKISQAQAKRLYALASEQGWSNEEAKDYLEVFGYKSSSEITVAHYDDICDYIKKNPMGGDHP